MTTEFHKFQELIISSSDSILTAIGIMNNTGQKFVMVADEHYLVGVLTDGDLRKFLESSNELTLPVKRVMNENPITVDYIDRNEITDLMMDNYGIDAIPLVEKNRKIAGLVIRTKKSSNCIFVIMAGGQGTRLLPHTQNLPKPLVRIAGKPIIDFILDKAAKEGIHRVCISLNHLGSLIESHCGLGTRWGLQISYITEDVPLGTCGALSMLDNSEEMPVLVTNSDVIFPESYQSMLNFHLDQGADVTIAGVSRTDISKYGELEFEGNRVIRVREKPTRTFQILGGVYCFNPQVLKHLKYGAPIDMPDFINHLIANGLRVMLWSLSSEWWDIGQEADMLDAERWIQRNNYGA